MARTPEDDFGGQAGASNAPQVITANGQDVIDLPGADFIKNAEILRDGQDLVLQAPDGSTVVIEGYFNAEPAPALQAPNGERLTPQLVQSFVQHTGEAQYAQKGSLDDESPVGAIKEVSGKATVTRTDGSTENITIGTPIFEGDIIETEGDGAVNIVFIDETSLAVSENAKLAIDEYVFDPSSESGTTDVSVLRGLFVFTSGLIGRDDPDDVNIDTPMGSIGIRGTIIAGNVTTGEITVMEGAIVLRAFNGNEVTLANQYETAKFNPATGSVEFMGKADPAAFANNFNAIKSVAGGFFNALGQSNQSDNANGEGNGASAEGAAGEAEGAQPEGEAAPAGADGAGDAPAGDGAMTGPAADPAAETAASETFMDTTFGGTDSGFDTSAGTATDSGSAGSATSTATAPAASGGTAGATATAPAPAPTPAGTDASAPPPPPSVIGNAAAPPPPPVPDITVGAPAINENSGIGANVGALAAVNMAGAVVFSETGNGTGAGLFQIDAAGNITVQAASLNFETQPSYTYEVQATDGTNTVTKMVTINLIDLDDNAPTLSVNNGTSVAEGGTTTITTAMLTAADVDTGNAGIAFTVVAAPANGVTLKLNGTPLAASQTFTMQDVINGLVTVSHDGTQPNGAGDFVFSVSDGTNAGPAGQTFQITVTGVNDAPTGGVTITGTVQENQVLTADISALADEDGLGAFSYQWMRNGANIGGATNSTYTLVNADAGANISVKVSYTDAEGTAETVTSAATGAVTNVNNAPALDTTGSPAMTAVNEDDANPAGDTVTNIVNSAISDPDGAIVDSIAVTGVDDGNGTWEFSIDGGTIWTNVGVVSVSSALVLNGAAMLRFVPDAGFNGAASFSYKAWDETDGSVNGDTGVDTTASDAFSTATESVSIAVNPVNDAPTLDLDTISGGNDFTTTFTEDGGPVNIGGNVSVIDDDDANIESATITLTNRLDGAQETLTHPSGNTIVSGVTISGSGTDSITLSGTAPLATYNSIIAQILYNNASDNPDTTDRVIEVTVNDGTANSNTATTTISVVGDSNDADSYASTPGNDFITGDDGNDTFQSAAGDGDDSFVGGGGDDIFQVADGDGSDTLDGGIHTTWDTYDAAGAATPMDFNLGASGNGTVTNGGDTDTVTGFERFIGGIGDDTFIINDPNYAYTVNGTSGANDSLDFSGLANGVTVDMSNGDAIISGGATINFSNIDTIAGSSVNDTFIVSAGESANHTYDGLGGNDVYNASNWTGNIDVDLNLSSMQVQLGAIFDDVFNIETFIGTDFADSFQGDSSDNIFFGGLGADIFFYSAGNDQLHGEDGGSDTYDASGSASAMTVNLAGTINVAGDTQTFSDIENFITGTGSDTFIVNAASAGIANDFDGFTGIDLIDYSAFAAGNFISVSLTGATVTATVNGGTSDLLTGIENIRGSQGDDQIDANGDTGVNLIHGDAGNDMLTGGNGDRLFGEAGADTLLYQGAPAQAFELDGGIGSDTLETGGSVTLNMSSNGNAQKIFGGTGTDTFNIWSGGNIILNPDGSEDRIEGVEVFDFRANNLANTIDIDLRNFMITTTDGSMLTIRIDDAGGGGPTDTLNLDFSALGGGWFASGSGANWFEYSNGTYDVRIEHEGSSAIGGNIIVTGVPAGPAPLDLNSIAPAAGYKIWDSTGQALGYSMAAMGDANADGYDDMLIVERNGGAGEVFSRLGAATGFTGGQMATSSTFTSGQFANVDEMKVASAGDFNGDGVNDYILSSSQEGGGQGAVKILSGTDSTLLTEITGFSGLSNAGASIAGIGDVNNDGFDDIIIGAPNAAGGGTSRGETYVIFGDGPVPPATINIGSLAAADGFKLFGTPNLAFLGQNVMSAGDVNGDGMSDFMVSSPGEANVRIVLGGAGLNNGADSGEIITLTGVSAGGSNSIPLLNLGDMNGDGRTDIALWEKGPVQGGNIRIFSGASLPAGGGNAAMGSAALTITAGANRHLLEVGSVGDFNGDGYDDLAVAVGTNGSNTIDIYVLHGWDGMGGSIDTTGFNPSNSFHMTYAVTNTAALSSSNWTLSAFDITLSNAGDVNGDGLYDLFIGMPDEDLNAGIDSDNADADANNATGNTDDSDGASFTVYGKAEMKVINDNMGPDVNATLVNHWRFDEMSGTSAGDSVGGFHGTTFNNPLLNQPGRAGSSFSFDGDDYIDVGPGAMPTGTNYTISLWASADNLAMMQNFISINSSGGGGGGLYFGLSAGGNLEFGYGATSVASATGGYDDGTFHQFAMTFNAGTVKLYVDGVEVGSNTGFANFTSPTSSLFFGKNHSGGGWLSGEMDDVKIFSSTLNATDMQALHDGHYDTNRAASAISASTNGQSLLGTDSIDMLSDNGMYDVSFSGGKGSDAIILSNGNFRAIDGGGGMDFIDTNGNLDLSSFSREEITRLEEIKLATGGPAQTLTLTYANIFNLMETSDNGTFKINSLGSGGNTLNLDTAAAPQGAAGEGMIATALGADSSDNGTTLAGFYTFDFGGYTLYIDNTITVNLT